MCSHKLQSFLAIIVVLSIMLAGCSPAASTDAPQSTTAQGIKATTPPQPESITEPEATKAEGRTPPELEGEISYQFWEDAEQAKAHIYPNQQWQKTYDQIMDWLAMHPKVKLNISSDLSANEDDRKNNMRTALINGTLPDLMSGYPNPEVIRNNTDLYYNLKEDLKKPNPYGTAPTWADEFPNDIHITNSGFYNKETMRQHEDYFFIGAQMGKPTGTDVIYYNKDMFEKAGVTEVPRTWQEYIEACKKLKAAGFAPYYKDVNPGRDLNWDIAYLTESVAEGTYGKVFKAFRMQPEIFSASLEMRWWMYRSGLIKTDGKEIQEVARLWKEWSQYWNEDYAAVEPGVNYLLTERVAMIHDGNWAIDTYFDGAKEAGFRIGSFSMPVIGPETSPIATGANPNWGTGPGFAGGSSFFIPKTTTKDPNKLAIVIDLLQYLTARPQRDAWCQVQTIPCMDEGQTVEDVLKAIPAEKHDIMRGFLEPDLTQTKNGYYGFWLTPDDPGDSLKRLLVAYLHDDVTMDDFGKNLGKSLDTLWETTKAEHPEWKVEQWPAASSN